MHEIDKPDIKIQLFDKFRRLIDCKPFQIFPKCFDHSYFELQKFVIISFFLTLERFFRFVTYNSLKRDSMRSEFRVLIELGKVMLTGKWYNAHILSLFFKAFGEQVQSYRESNVGVLGEVNRNIRFEIAIATDGA